MSPRSSQPDDLIRNVAGIARDRAKGAEADDLELEAAIAQNVRALRTRYDLSVTELAERIGISKAMLSKIENAQTSCSLSTLSRLARGLDVPVSSLIRGADSEREAAHTKAGAGASITRSGTKQGHSYELLGALRGEHKRLECLMVTLSEDSEVYPLFQHPGTEFLHMVEGAMDYGHGRSVYRMEPGDSLTLDGEAPHGPVRLIDLPIRFLSVVAFPDGV
ncbi:helix-turn-helix domain-containing protein [Nocardioides sambongensis]|uniref:helix-turn-helix domain-containing protein n=1 Tax=Nocardioides sambongensis TaxID=2589074 RepID=UPI00112872C8|nr:XRE family transcriptional regulator [Nocardioides sambongensis]